MCDTVFAFGEGESWLIECPSRWSLNNLPTDLLFVFKEKVVTSTYCMAFGPNGGYVFSFKADTGKTRIMTMNIPEKLKTWIFTKDSSGKLIRDFQHLSVSLGPDGKAFFAMDGINFIWDSLPDGLYTQVMKRIRNGTFTDAPRLVTLGYSGNYFMLTQDNACCWDTTHYPELTAAMPTFRDNSAFHTIKNLVLSFHTAGQFGGNLKSGTSFVENMPASATEAMKDMEKAIQSDSDAAHKQEQQRQAAESEARIANINRSIQLSKMATALADAGTRNAMQSSMFMNNLGYQCRYCKNNPAYCTCGGGGMGSI